MPHLDAPYTMVHLYKDTAFLFDNRTAHPDRIRV